MRYWTQAGRLALLAGLLVVIGLGFEMAWRYTLAAALVSRASGMQEAWAAGLARLGARPCTTREITVPTRTGSIRGRVYSPAPRTRCAVLLVPGVHAMGIDEPRLTKFAGDLAAAGGTIVTVELPDLLRYQITPRLTDEIEDAAAWLLRDPELAPGGRVGVIGISFAGGLSIVAAGRERIRDRVAFTLSFGGHGDLPRVLRYLCTGKQPDGSYRAPHDYGVAVILLNAAGLVVPPEQVDGLREGILTFLHASHLTLVDTRMAEDEFDRARLMEKTLLSPAAELLHLVNSRDVQALGPHLLPHVEKFASSDALSPCRSPAPACPVYLLHGADDNVIPAIESPLAAEYLGRRCPVHLLVTPLITHAEVDRRRHVSDIWRLIAFWKDLLDE